MRIPQCIILEIPDTQSMIAYMILTEHFWKLWELLLTHPIQRSTFNTIVRFDALYIVYSHKTYSVRIRKLHRTSHKYSIEKSIILEDHFLIIKYLSRSFLTMN